MSNPEMQEEKGHRHFFQQYPFEPPYCDCGVIVIDYLNQRESDLQRYRKALEEIRDDPRPSAHLLRRIAEEALDSDE